MYVHVRLVNHGLSYMRYLTGETSYKDSPDRIIRVDIPVKGDLYSTTNRYIQMRLDTMPANAELSGFTIQVTLSPMKEDTVNYTGSDWANLWMTFLEEMDKIDCISVKDPKLKDGVSNGEGKDLTKQGLADTNSKEESDEVLLPEHNQNEEALAKQVNPTNLCDCHQLACLHLESNSSIPHIHAAIAPVDCNGVSFGLDYLLERAKMASEEVIRKLSLTDPQSEEGNNLSTAYHTCLDTILEMMDSWSWEQFKKGVTERNYRIIEKKDKRGNVLSWAMERDGKVFKDREMGKSMLIQNIPWLWHNLIEPYNEPAELLTVEQLMREVKLRGWYQRFLRGEIHDRQEAKLYELLCNAIEREHYERDYERYEYGRKGDYAYDGREFFSNGNLRFFNDDSSYGYQYYDYEGYEDEVYDDEFYGQNLSNEDQDMAFEYTMGVDRNYTDPGFEEETPIKFVNIKKDGTSKIVSASRRPSQSQSQSMDSSGLTLQNQLHPLSDQQVDRPL